MNHKLASPLAKTGLPGGLPSPPNLHNPALVTKEATNAQTPADTAPDLLDDNESLQQARRVGHHLDHLQRRGTGQHYQNGREDEQNQWGHQLDRRFLGALFGGLTAFDA